MKIEDLLAKSSEEIATLPAKEQREILKLIEEYQEAQAIEAARTDFMAFVRYIWPEFIEGPHHKIVADILNKIQRGELNRAITNMAPRMTKSELHSWLYPAWRMGLNPAMKIIQCSHSAELAEGFGRRVRDLIQTKEFKKVFPECRLSSNSGAAHRWATDKGGTYFAIGVDGKLAGKGADLLIIDDPHAEAESVYGTDTGFERVYNWYKAGPRQRLQPGAAIIVCMCMTGDTRVRLPDGGEKLLKDIRAGDTVSTYENGRLSESKVNNWMSSGVDAVYKVKTKSGKMLRANARHPFLVDLGGTRKWVRLKNLKTGDLLVSLKDAVAPQEQKQNKVFATPAPLKKATTRKILTPPTEKWGITESGKENYAKQRDAIGQSRLKGFAQSAMSKAERINFHLFLQKNAEATESSQGTESLPKSMIKWLQSAATVATYAVKSLTTGTLAPIGAENFVSTTATTQAKSEGFFVTTATSLSDTGSGPKSLKAQPDTSVFTLDQIVEIVQDGEEEVFDVEIDRTENFIANGVVSHNTRWSKLDLTGQLVSSMSKRGGESWHVTEFPAILHENTPDEKSIWPEYWPLEELKATKNEVGHVAWAAQYQQALALDTPIPTPDGWSTIGNLRPGDFVIGADGRPTEVLWKSKVYKNRPTFFVQTDDGACVEADADHLWSVDLGRESKGEVVRTTQELFDRQEARKKLPIAPRRPKIKDALRWSLPDVSLPLDPYLLGAWLGDGTAASSYFTSSDEDAPHWAESFSAAGFEFVKYSKPYSYNVKGLAKHLRAAGVLGNKHVPEKYLRASAEQRLALLQGLMDTDGHCSRGQAQFANTNTRIVKAVEELVLSLGAKPCTTSFVPPKGKRCYKVCFYMEDAFRLPRKRRNCRNKKSKHGRFVSIKQAGFSDTACIRVAAEDQLFLAGKKCLVTHNCPTSREAVIISRDKWKIWEDRDPPPCDYVIQTWDTAHEKGNRNDPSAMQTWGVFHLTDEDTGIAKPNVILLDAFKKRMHFPELKRQCLEEYRRSQPDSVLIEGRASGKSLVQELRSMGLPIVEYTVGRGTAKMPNDKISRVNSVSDIFESGLVWAPETRFAEEVMEEVADFPAGEHDDYVDCMVMALRRFRDGAFIRLENDFEPEPLQRRRAAYY
jgi:predicted phage terminase large subunit-like protein